MKGRYLFVALVLTTGCSAILGFNDGKLSPGLKGDPCDLYSSPSTPCAATFGCFASTCFEDCPSNSSCPTGTRCLPTDEPGSNGSVTQHTVCVPLDKAHCTQNSGNTNAPVCTNGGMEQCWNGECRATCQLPFTSQGGTAAAPGQSCHSGEVCIAQNPNGNQGFCYAPGEAPDSGTTSGTTGTDLFVFGGNIDGPIAVGNANVYFGKDAGLWACAKTGCNGSGGPPSGAMNVSMGAMTPRFITAYGGGRVAWAYGQGGPSGIQRCNEAGSSCQVVPGFPYGGTQVSALQGLDQRLYWITISGQNLQLNLYDETFSMDAGSPTVGGFPMATVPNQPNIGYHAISPEQHVVQVAGQMYAVLVKQPAVQGNAISNDPTLFNFQGAPLITHGASRLVWVVETAEKSQLEQCHLDPSPSHDFVCLPDMGTFHDYKPQGAKVTALGSNGTMIFWSEWANETSTIRACAPDPSSQFTSPACGSRLLTAEGNLPGKVVSLVADADGYVYYMLAYNSANQRNGVNFALRRVKGP